MAAARSLGAIDIIDLTEDNETIDKGDVSLLGRSVTISRSRAVGGAISSDYNESPDSVVSKADAARILLNDRIQSSQDLSKSSSFGNPTTPKKPGFRDQIDRTVSNVLQSPTTSETKPSPRPLPYQPPKPATLPRVRHSVLRLATASPANTGQRVLTSVWDLPDSDWEEYLSESEKSKRDTPTTTPESAEHISLSNRTPRTAARDANRAIAGSYAYLNPLEARLEARFSSPQKPGRPRKEEWTPKSGSSRRGQNSEIRGQRNREDSLSPTPRERPSSRSAVTEKAQSANTTPKHTSPKKRKRSSASGDSTPRFKLPKTTILQFFKANNTIDTPEGNHEILGLAQQSQYNPDLDILEPALDAPNGPPAVRVHSISPQQSTRISGPTTDIPILNVPKDSQVLGRRSLTPAHPAPVMAQPAKEASRSISSYVPVTNVKVKAIYEMMVFPAIKKIERCYKGSLSSETLKTISKSVSVDIVKHELEPYVLGTLTEPDEKLKKHIKRAVEKGYKKRVAESSTPVVEPVRTSRTIPQIQSKDSPDQYGADNMEEKPIYDRDPEARANEYDESGAAQELSGNKITDLSAYLKTLEDQASQSDTDLVTARKSLGREEDTAAIATNELELADRAIILPPFACRECQNAHRRCTHKEFNREDPIKFVNSDPRSDTSKSNVQTKVISSIKKSAGLEQTLGRDDANDTRVEIDTISHPPVKQAPCLDCRTRHNRCVHNELSNTDSILLDAHKGDDPKVQGLPKVRIPDKDTLLQYHSQQDIPGVHSLLTATSSPIISDSFDNSCDLDFASDEPFPPGFDRGRFPVQRRRRANKYYNPGRPPVTSSGHVPTKSAVSNNREFGRAIANSVETTTHNARNQSGQFTRSDNFVESIPSQDILKNELAKRINSDQTMKQLIQIIGSGKMSPSQLEVFEKYINNVGSSMPALMNQPTIMMDMLQNRGHQSSLHPEPGQLEALRETANSMIIPLRRDLSLVFRPLGTALDPHLEHVVAMLSTSDSSANPRSHNQNRYHITDEDQEILAKDQVILKDTDTTRSKFVTIETRVIDPAYRPQRTTPSLLRQRELGFSRRRDIDELRLRNTELIEPWRYWKGASGDIVAATWSPDSTTYAVGAAAHTNPEDLQYNRPCNLLLGELATNVLTELPDHRVDRPKPETIPHGPNATQAVYEACDPMLYKTVTSVAFSSTGNRMYTASHDQTVKVWDVPRKRCIATLAHDAWVTSLEASAQRPGLFATGSKCIQDSIRIYYSQASENENSLCRTQFSSSRAKMRPRRQIHPECLRWGPTAFNNHLLLAGFHQESDDGERSPGEGQLVLWDANTFQTVKVSPSSQSVYAAAWHPIQPFFATGGTPGSVITDKYNTKSVVRTWDVRSSGHSTMEYECSALDMQDITFSPSNSNIVTAGCTDGTSFVWDFRRPDQPIHRLRHGRPIVGWDLGEEFDTGVMMSLWGLGGALFYTGSSDGMIKAWDIRRHPQDVLIRNVAQFGAGIQSGAFSPDGTNLLVGDAEGGVHVLSSAPCGPRTESYNRGSNCKEESITLVRDPNGSERRLVADDNIGAEGVAAASKLIRSGQLQYDTELGVGKGPNYHGPYATCLRETPKQENKRGRILPEADKYQPYSRQGVRREEICIARRGLLDGRRNLILQERNKQRPEENKKTARVLERLRENLLLRAASEADTSRSSSASRAPNLGSIPSVSQASSVGRLSAMRRSESSKASDLDSTYSFSDSDIPESEMVEENHWWPRLGEDEIELARQGKRPAHNELY